MSVTARDYLQSQFDNMSIVEAQTIRDEWKELGYFHQVFDKWISGIQKELGFKELSDSLRKSLVRFVILYFSDVFELNITNLSIRKKEIAK